MSDTKALAIYTQFDEIQKIADAMFKSGYFKDVTSVAQAIVKIHAGAEIGIPAFASLSGINIIQGKPTLGANLLATLVKNDPRYDYRVKKCDNTECILTWYEDGKPVGESSFTMKEAQEGKVDCSWDKEKNEWKQKATWKAYPSDMLFARAISRGTRRFAPGVFGGSPVYTPDEMGVDTDEEGVIVGQAVDVPEQSNTTINQPDTQPTVTEKPVPSTPTDVKPMNGGTRPYRPAVLAERIYERAKNYINKTATQKQRNLVVMLLDQMFSGSRAEIELARHAVLDHVFEHSSMKELDDSTILAMLNDWLKPVADSGGAYTADEMAIKEVQLAYEEAIKAQGQATLDI